MRAVVLGLLVLAALPVLPAGAAAQPVNGFYIGGGLGADFLHSQTTKTPAASGFAPAPVPSDPAAPGAAGHGSLGYGLGNGLRLELEGSGGANRLRLPQGP